MDTVVSIDRSKERYSQIGNAKREIKKAATLEENIVKMRQLEQDLVLTEIETFHLSEQIKIFVDAARQYRHNALKMRMG